MDTNPFADQAPAREPPPARKYEFVWRALSFVIGFAISWVIWASWQTWTQRPQDATVILPEELREDAPEWMWSAKARNVGKFVIIAAADARIASAQVNPRGDNRYPGVIFDDRNADGQIDSLTLVDAGRKTFEMAVADGKFKFYSYSADPFAENDVTSYDYDFDGRPDFRLGPKGRLTLRVEDQWYNFVPEGGGKGYVTINGTRVPAEFVDGMFRLVAEK